MPRDNFTAKVVERLRTRVAHKCSNPDCRVPTVGPGKEPLSIANIGKASHIAAASPGGPRYVTTMTSGERSSISNAIWLCSNCATEIDVHEDSYSITLLQEWKRLAEDAANTEKGKRPPHPDDARNQLVAALSGMPAPFTCTAIPNVHSASEQALHILDPRFRIETSYRDKTTTYNVHALENVNFNLNVPVPLAKEWHAALENLFDHGQDAKLPAAGVEVNGLPLLEKMLSSQMQDSASIRIESDKKPAVLKLKLLKPETQQFEQFDDITGNVSYGRKSLTFEGTACGRLLQMSLNIPWERLGHNIGFNLTVRLDEWDKRDLRYLPHFDKLLHLIEMLVSWWQIDIGLEIEGLPVLRAKANFPAEADDVWSSSHLALSHIALIRKIVAYMDATVTYASGYTITQADFQRIMEVVDIIEGRRVFDRSAMKENPTCQLIAQDEASNIRYLTENKSNGVIAIRSDDGEKIIVFGQTIQMPKMEVRFDGVCPKIRQGDVSTIKDGDVVQVELEPTDGFQCRFKYLNDKEFA
jgi:hypothetical protein